jgi:2-oxo-4-hydroxy-4-carboxy--5-ureidoimidazoline (OHCU) decarboxylase
MSDQATSIAALNAAQQGDFVGVLGDIVEHSPWVAERIPLQKVAESVVNQ